jgi:hypothetical protein
MNLVADEPEDRYMLTGSYVKLIPFLPLKPPRAIDEVVDRLENSSERE